MYREYKNSFKNQFRSMNSLIVYRTGRQQCPKNFHRGWEVRPFYLLHYVIKGKGTYFIEDRKFQVTQGQAFLIYPGMKIDYKADREQPWEYCWVGFNGPDAQMLIDSTMFTIENPVVTFSDIKIKRLILDIYRCRGSQNYKLILMIARLYTLIAYLIEIAQKDFPSSQMDYQYVHAAISLIKEQYTQANLSIQDIAQQVNISRSKLYRAFMEIAGISPIQYLAEQRISAACALLARTDIPIKKITAKVGFKDSLYFSKVFKKKMQRTPRQYRKEPVSPTVFLKTVY